MTEPVISESRVAVRSEILTILRKTLRIKQWTKNLLLFAGLIFARQLHDPAQLLKVGWAFAAFCMLSSALYIFNDLLDLEKDRNHPRKKYRPLASGALKIPLAIGIMTGLLLGGLGITLYLNVLFFSLAALCYLGQTIAYSLFLKRVVIVDVMTLASGFVLRAVAGALVINVPISPWLLVCTMLLALFLALTKRRQELQTSGSNESRPVLDSYTIAFLDQVITIVTAATLTGYFLYAFTAHSVWMMLTIPFVIYGLFRYLLLTYARGWGEEPEQVLLSDWPFILNICLWLITSATIIYFV